MILTLIYGDGNPGKIKEVIPLIRRICTICLGFIVVVMAITAFQAEYWISFIAPLDDPDLIGKTVAPLLVVVCGLPVICISTVVFNSISGDRLISKHVFANIFTNNADCSFICGNFTTELHGVLKKEEPYKGRNWLFSLYDIYSGDLCHQAFLIKADNFDKYGLYDEHLRISADWKLFFVAIGIHHEPVLYKDVDMVIYNMEGLSSTIGGKAISAERRRVVHDILPEEVANKLDRALHLERNSYIIDIILSRKWIHNFFRAFCKMGRILGFIKS